MEGWKREETLTQYNVVCKAIAAEANKDDEEEEDDEEDDAPLPGDADGSFDLGEDTCRLAVRSSHSCTSIPLQCSCDFTQLVVCM